MKRIMPKSLFSGFCFGVLFLIISFLLPEGTEMDDLFVKTAEARIGRPATPTSVAGVHRRHARRTVRRHHRRHHYLRTLPGGCIKVVTRDVTYYRCGAVYYRPYYEGTELVYIVVDAP